MNAFGRTLETINESQNIKNIFTLDGVNSLNLIKMVNGKNVETTTFPLYEVTKEDLVRYREDKTPSFVLKIEDKLYHAVIPKNISLLTSHLVGSHMCSIGNDVCERLSPAPDKEGGCAKVRNRSSYIERYTWIKKGFETFNTYHNCLVVGTCSHYAPCSKPKSKSIKEINKAKLSLAHYLWPELENLNEINKKLDENLDKKI